MSNPQGDAEPMPRDESILSADGIELKGWSWRQSKGSARGVLVIAHGYGEHSGNYAPLAEALGPTLGLDVLAFDFRGHGRSPGRRGWLRRYEEMLDDLKGALVWADRNLRRTGEPIFLLGHSNGGLVCLRTLLAGTGGVAVAGLILSNPTTRVAVPVPAWKLGLAGVLRRYAPWVALSSALQPEMLTSDPLRREARRNDLACHDRITAPLYFGMIEAGEDVLARAGEIEVPTLLLLGEADPIIDPDAGRLLFDRLGTADKTLCSYPGMRHEPFNEVGRRQVLRDVQDWLDCRLPPHRDRGSVTDFGS
ncbi:alpha/beta hydrolase [soil metagenome]